MATTILRLTGVKKSYPQAGGVLEILKGIDLSIAAGEIVALVGSSGAGKSTLLHVAGLLDHATDGTVSIGGRDATLFNDDQRAAVRRDKIGFVYQFHHLLPDFTAEENVSLPLMIGGIDKSTAATTAQKALKGMGLSDRLDHIPAKLSGGEQQRVAIARALSTQPALLLADEPTGNLDTETAKTVLDAMLGLVRKQGVAALIATHDLSLAAQMDRQIRIQDGYLVNL